jgi:hypothetical protein
MIDEIHNLCGAKHDKPFFILKDLYNETETAQLWSGTNDLVKYFNRQILRDHDESLAQIRRRIFPAVDLMEGVRTDGGGEPLWSIDQIREAFAHNKLKLTGGAARFLAMLANMPDSGSIGLCVQLVEYVTAIGRNLTSIDVPVLKQAMQRGMTNARAELLLHNLEEPAAAPAAKAG